MTPTILHAYLLRARDEQLGLILSTNNPQRLVMLLHSADATSPVPEVEICLPSTEGEVFLVKKSVELD